LTEVPGFERIERKWRYEIMRKGGNELTGAKLHAVHVSRNVGCERTQTANEPNCVVEPNGELDGSSVGVLPQDEDRIYLRGTGKEMSPADVRDLETLMDMLRSYYDIPADQPVFPKRPRSLTDVKRAKPSKTATNRADHPWRGAA
jgi:hypothetical protein